MHGRFSPLMLGCGLATLLVLLSAGKAEAHRLMINERVVADQQVVLFCWFDQIGKPHPAVEADIEVARPGREPLRGKTDERGLFTFHYDKAEPLRITVKKDDHEATLTIPAERLPVAAAKPEHEPDKEKPAPSDQAATTAHHPAPSNAAAVEAASRDLMASAQDQSQQLARDALLGVTFFLSLAAFVLSLRNARRLRELNAPSRPTVAQPPVNGVAHTEITCNPRPPQ